MHGVFAANPDSRRNHANARTIFCALTAHHNTGCAKGESRPHSQNALGLVISANMVPKFSKFSPFLPTLDA